MHRATAAYAMVLILLVGAACGPTIVSPTPVPTSQPTPSVSPTPASAVPTESGPPGVAEAVWTRLTPGGPGPAARLGHTWTVDPDRGLAFLFGGRTDAAVFDDLWVYDLAADTWSGLAAVGARPAARAGHSAAWVDGVGLVVVGGRGADDAALADAWRFDPDAALWSELPTGAQVPPARSDTCAVVDHAGRLWISHGLGVAPLADTWRYDPAAEAWAATTPAGTGPAARSGHACWGTAADGLAILGGDGTAGSVDDAWLLDEPGSASAEWTRAALAPPTDPPSHAGIARHGDAVFIVGGIGLDGEPRNDVVRIDDPTFGVESFWTSSAGPAPHSHAALVDDPAAERLLLFGGATSATSGPAESLADLWQLTPP